MRNMSAHNWTLEYLVDKLTYDVGMVLIFELFVDWLKHGFVIRWADDNCITL